MALACVALVVRVGNPVSWVDERWDEFSHPAAAAAAAPSDASRFGTGVSNRYDYWRVAALVAPTIRWAASARARSPSPGSASARSTRT